MARSAAVWNGWRPIRRAESSAWVLGAGDGAFAAAEEELEPLDEVRKLMADGVDKKAALAQVAKNVKFPNGSYIIN